MKRIVRLLLTSSFCLTLASTTAWATPLTYYSQGNLPVNVYSSWNTQADGLGSPPSNFTSDVYYVIQSGHSMTTTAPWIVSTTIARSITINSGGSLTLSNDVTINSNLTFIVNGSLDCGTNAINGSGATTVNSSATIKIGHADGLAGNIATIGSNSFSPGATYVYNGSAAQAISTFLPDNLTGILKINNSNGVSLNRDLTITTGTLDLTLGTLKTRFGVSTVQNLSLASTASVSNYSSNSFVDGPLIATLASGVDRTFPIGSGTTYRPLTLNMSAGQNVTAEMFNSPPSGSFTGIGVDKISLVRYYSISNADPSNCTVTLPWGSDDGVSDLTNITAVYGANSIVWSSNDRSGGTTGNASSGTVTGTFNSIIGADFTLGNKTGGTNPLPVETTSFTAVAQKMSAHLKWSTATEINNHGFEIERRRIAGSDWQKVGFVTGAGTSDCAHEYSFSDNDVTAGSFAYRLKQIDNSGSFKYSQEIQVTIEVPNIFSLNQNYPNPFNPSTTIQYALPARSRVRLQVYNTLGQIVADLINAEQAAGWNQVVWNANVASGLYFYRLEAVSVTDPTKRFVDVKKLLFLK